MVNLISIYRQWSRFYRQSYLSEVVAEQIEDGESYLHVSAMEQILAIGLISLRFYLPEIAAEQIFADGESYFHVSAMEQILPPSLISLT
ncbi:hypothetical protein F383_37226 [Gossypium arboreum]|uniref:Uncharacterized protein n=1 Tax=Gossypium arboreum TaxID=29729 RepID=A0A0B0MGR9_GOSAR|nr:hypothetical protein F383_37226 [Gossypium arboreum]